MKHHLCSCGRCSRHLRRIQVIIRAERDRAGSRAFALATYPHIDRLLEQIMGTKSLDIEIEAGRKNRDETRQLVARILAKEFARSAATGDHVPFVPDLLAQLVGKGFDREAAAEYLSSLGLPPDPLPTPRTTRSERTSATTRPTSMRGSQRSGDRPTDEADV